MQDTEVRKSQGFTAAEIDAIYAYATTFQTVADSANLDDALEYASWFEEVN